MLPVRSLRRLCADYDRLGRSSMLVDFQAMDRWYARAEQVMEACFAAAATHEQARAALCRCLTCYFYLPCPDRTDPWFAYLMSTADAWAGTFSPRRGWEGLKLGEALDRIEVMNRISYMLLDHSRDAVIRGAYDFYAGCMKAAAQVPANVWKKWRMLRTEGNAIPLGQKSMQ